MLTEATVREAWLRAEAVCKCRKDAHGHPGRCAQFLIWAERGEAGMGGWEARELSDPRRCPCEILCVACYAKATRRGPTEATGFQPERWEKHGSQEWIRSLGI